jgi:hypothetical protein
MLVKTLKWPVISLVVTGMLHLLAEMLLPDLKNSIQPTVIAVILFPFGVWVGYKAIQNGAGFVMAIVFGAILGVLPLALDVVGFGMILGRGVQVGLVSGIFGFLMIVFGSLLGSGFASSK